MADILVCPFCGGRPEIKMGFASVYISCRLCSTKGPRYRFRWFDEDSYQQAENWAVRAWNRRLYGGKKAKDQPK
ncbi:MAG: Lar family restriction alleviation protein [Firmicutes bacterium]|nr:Lar family restriction alleviation protein [Bacillota bacterium]